MKIELLLSNNITHECMKKIRKCNFENVLKQAKIWFCKQLRVKVWFYQNLYRTFLIVCLKGLLGLWVFTWAYWLFNLGYQVSGFGLGIYELGPLGLIFIWASLLIKKKKKKKKGGSWVDSFYMDLDT